MLLALLQPIRVMGMLGALPAADTGYAITIPTATNYDQWPIHDTVTTESWAGGWGSMCTCPTGLSHYVADKFTHGASFHCYGGVVGWQRFNHNGGAWSNKVVTCAEKPIDYDWPWTPWSVSSQRLPAASSFTKRFSKIINIIGPRTPPLPLIRMAKFAPHLQGGVRYNIILCGSM